MFKMSSFKWQWEHHGSIHFCRKLFPWMKANVKSSRTSVFTTCCLERCSPHPWPQLARTPFPVPGRLLSFLQHPCFIICCFSPATSPDHWALGGFSASDSAYLGSGPLACTCLLPERVPLVSTLLATWSQVLQKKVPCHIALSILHRPAQWMIDARCSVNISHGKDLKAIKHWYSQVDLCKNQVTFRKKTIQITNLFFGIMESI